MGEYVTEYDKIKNKMGPSCHACKRCIAMTITVN